MIGILGGTFDPIHYGHLRPAQDAQRALKFEQLRFIPAADPPHREAPVATAAQRLHMVELAVADFPEFVCDDREIRRGEPSYTVPTLESLREELGERPLCLLIGMDAFCCLETWYQWQRLLELAHLIVMPRPGWLPPPTDESLPAWARGRVCRDPDELKQINNAGRLWFQEVTLQDISGTRIRSAIAKGESVQGLLPDAVWEYIRHEGIYQGPEE